MVEVQPSLNTQLLKKVRANSIFLKLRKIDKYTLWFKVTEGT